MQLPGAPGPGRERAVGPWRAPGCARTERSGCEAGSSSRGRMALPGFRIPAGSNTNLICRCSSWTSACCSWPSQRSLNWPTPCSPVMVPPIARATRDRFIQGSVQALDAGAALCRIHPERGMQVAVTGMRHHLEPHLVLAGHPVQLGNVGHQPGAGHRHVLADPDSVCTASPRLCRRRSTSASASSESSRLTVPPSAANTARRRRPQPRRRIRRSGSAAALPPDAQIRAVDGVQRRHGRRRRAVP